MYNADNYTIARNIDVLTSSDGPVAENPRLKVSLLSKQAVLLNNCISCLIITIIADGLSPRDHTWLR